MKGAHKTNILNIARERDEIGTFQQNYIEINGEKNIASFTALRAMLDLLFFYVVFVFNESLRMVHFIQ